jgi:hypothetical protein
MHCILQLSLLRLLLWLQLVEFNAIMLRGAAAQAPAMGLNGTQSPTAFVEELHK